jgi:hypothetical protein
MNNTDYSAIESRILCYGVKIEVQADVKHWKISHGELIVNYWPSTGSCFVFGKSFKASPEKLCEAMISGRIRMPEDANEAKCKRCGAPIWWVVSTKSGRNLPVDYSGESHFSTCPGRDEMKSPW